MKSTYGGLSVLIALCQLTGCGDSGGDSGGDPVPTVIEMPTWETEVDPTTPINELTQEQIDAECAAIESTLTEADQLLACRVVAVGDTEDATACVAAEEDCNEEPGDSLSRSEVSAAPEPIDCSAFTVEAAATCTHTIGELEDCINKISASLEGSTEEVTCDEADDYDLAEANDKAAYYQSVTGYISTCKPLEECEALVNVLLGDE